MFWRVAALLVLWLPFAARAEGTSDPLAERVLAVLQPVRGLPYNGKWAPPGGGEAWRMDCSNTSRWLTREVFGRELPRTASGQYEALRREGRLRRTGRDPGRLAKILRPGDLLFWEHTYRPARKPPVTHVMVFLGRDLAGGLLMAGAQSSRGVNVYSFRPDKPNGGYRWLIFFRRSGRFVAYGRPG